MFSCFRNLPIFMIQCCKICSWYSPLFQPKVQIHLRCPGNFVLPFLGWWKRDPFKGSWWPPNRPPTKVTTWIIWVFVTAVVAPKNLPSAILPIIYQQIETHRNGILCPMEKNGWHFTSVQHIHRFSCEKKKKKNMVCLRKTWEAPTFRLKSLFFSNRTLGGKKNNFCLSTI